MTLQINTTTGQRALTADEQTEVREGIGAQSAAQVTAAASSAATTAASAVVAAHAAATDPHPGRYAPAAHTHALLMTQPERDKLAGIAPAATANATDAALRDRATHTGTQPIASVDGLQTALDGKAPSAHTHTAAQISDATAAGRGLLTATDAAAQRTALALGNVNNTADADKPVSTAQAAAIVAATTADAIADTLETAPPADLARIQASVSRYMARGTAVAIGNSILACTGVATPCASWFEVACLRLGLIPLKNAGVSGENQTEIQARFAADVIAIAPDIVFIGNDAANSIGDAVSVQAAVAATYAMCNAALAAGIEPVLVACSPFNSQPSVSSYNVAYRRVAEMLNLKWLDPWSEMWGNGNWKVTTPTLTIDNLHPSGYAGRLAGYKAAEQYATKLPAMLPTINADPAGPNKNALFQSSAGWTPGAQTALSLVAGVGEVVGNWLTYTVTAAAGWQTSSGPAIPMTGFAGGDMVRAVFRIKTTGFEAAGSAGNTQYSVQGVLGVYLVFSWSGGSGGGAAPQTRQLTMSDVDGIVAHEFVWPAGYTTITPQVIITRIGPSTPNCTVAIAQMQFYNITKIPS